MKRAAKWHGGLVQALYACSNNSYDSELREKLWQMLTNLYGKAPSQLNTLQEFWHPKLCKAVIQLTDRQFLKDMQDITALRMRGQFSESMYRRSYRSGNVGCYAGWLVLDLIWQLETYWYRESVEEALACNLNYTKGYDLRLALELERNNSHMVDLIREAMLGENDTILVSTTMFRAIILSGHEELFELMLKLLDAARLQEGLRQSILEAADVGSVESLARILKFCIEKDMFRYSSAVRALDTWTGLGFGDEMRPAVVKKCAALAYETLTDETAAERYLDSPDSLEAYFGLWGISCREVRTGIQKAQKLLEDPQEYRRVLGWYYLSHVENPSYQMRVAAQFLEERNKKVLAWMMPCLASTWKLLSSYVYHRTDWNIRAIPNPAFPESPAERKVLFERLKDLALYLGNGEDTFTESPFVFSRILLNVQPVLNCMFSLAGYDLNPWMIQELHEMVGLMDVQLRRAFYVNFLSAEDTGTELGRTHRIWLREALKDRSSDIREIAVQRLSASSLSEEDLDALTEQLRSKKSSIRKGILTVLEQQPMEKLLPELQKMLVSREEYQIQGAAELLLHLKKDHSGLLEQCKDSLDALEERKLSTQTMILLEQLAGKNHADTGKQENTVTSQNWTLENGFGVYDPEVVNVYETETARRNLADGSVYKERELKAQFLSKAEIETVLDKMEAIFVRHADYEYEVLNWQGGKEKILFGDTASYIRIPAEYAEASRNRWKADFSMIPFYEEFLEAAGDQQPERILALCYQCYCYNGAGQPFGTEWEQWYRDLDKKRIGPSYHNAFSEKYGKRYWAMMDVIMQIPGYLAYQSPEKRHLFFETALKYYRSFVALYDGKLGNNIVKRQEDSRYSYCGGDYVPLFNDRMFGVWRILLGEFGRSDDTDFQTFYQMEYALEMQDGRCGAYELGRFDDFRAVDLGILPRDILTKTLMLGVSSNHKDAKNTFEMLTSPGHQGSRGRDLYEKFSWTKPYVKGLVERVVEVEQKRGELVTPVTEAAVGIRRFEGARYFCSLLAALGRENFYRGYSYYGERTKQAVLSQLLKACYPAKEDTPEELKTLLKQTDIKEKRLVEAAMYAPQWAGFVEQILGWPGFRSGVWFFHAHVNESFSAEKETEIAYYSPVSPEQFRDGTFDKDWFLDAYGKLGEKHFKLLYQSAKYITAGGNQHRRSQLYADAVLGKLDAAALEQEISEKRNQEKLRCYPLIPLAEEKTADALHRYEYIQHFLKESRKFGSARRESEKKACQVALENLAVTMELGDVNRMTWYLESEKLKEIAPYLEPKEIDEVTFYLVIAEDGSVSVQAEKKGKPLKNVPKALQKNEYVLNLKALAKDLKEQKQRGRESLERAMVERTEFGAEEISRILQNPVLAPMAKALVWNGDGQNGFPELIDGAMRLQGLKGSVKPEILRIAHPYDLMQTGEWAAYMHLLYEKKLTQPFKQVFREYYPITEDEKAEKTISRRYAGHQVQPAKTVALLKGRGWTVDYEEGLQKVFYKENLIVRMYALADWFSPADIEAPTLETVEFFDRGTGHNVDLETIPPVIFSETMRDLDLVVSVAHVGGVDPEASHSTVELRTALAREIISLLGLSNVAFIGSHAKIHGKLADYSVHLGSGVVHAETIGMLAILPVHSQARGRIFLPFADDDPKTAEILTKIVVLAEDSKLKDPSILSQLGR